MGLLIALLAQVAVPGAARAAVYEDYTLAGYEVWFTPTAGTFVGTGRGAAGKLSAWYARIEHSPSISPSGTVTGGRATLYRIDGVRISGDFGSGIVRQKNDGPGCTNEKHTVTGAIYRVTRSDIPDALGVGYLRATLIHYRSWILNRCITYSASVSGTISILV